MNVFPAARDLARVADLVVLHMRDLAPHDLDRWCSQTFVWSASGRARAEPRP